MAVEVVSSAARVRARRSPIGLPMGRENTCGLVDWKEKDEVFLVLSVQAMVIL